MHLDQDNIYEIASGTPAAELSCEELFNSLPSFYYTHTKEEIERIKEELVADLRKILEE